MAGVVESVGAGVTRFEEGQRVAALNVYGAFAELLIREAEHWGRGYCRSAIVKADESEDLWAASARFAGAERWSDSVSWARLRGLLGPSSMASPCCIGKTQGRLREDLPKVFGLLAEKKIDPLINCTFPLPEAGKALESLAAGPVEEKIVFTNG